MVRLKWGGAADWVASYSKADQGLAESSVGHLVRNILVEGYGHWYGYILIRQAGRH